MGSQLLSSGKEEYPKGKIDTVPIFKRIISRKRLTALAATPAAKPKGPLTFWEINREGKGKNEEKRLSLPQPFKERNHPMTTLELDAFKAELMDEITRDVRNAKSETDVYQRLQDMLRRRMSGMSGYITRQAKAWGKVPGIPCTLEEVKQQIAAYEREKAADAETLSEEEADAEIIKEMPWLK